MLEIIFVDKYTDVKADIDDAEFEFNPFKITGTDLNMTLVEVIENATLDAEHKIFFDKLGKPLHLSELSTGCKTALLVAANPTKTVSLIECGVNARDAIIKYIKDGRIILRYNGIGFNYTGDEDVSIKVKDKEFYSMNDFMKFVRFGEYL